jgi:hypothetical protein
VGKLTGTATISAGGQKMTIPSEQVFTDWDLEAGDFCP